MHRHQLFPLQLDCVVVELVDCHCFDDFGFDSVVVGFCVDLGYYFVFLDDLDVVQFVLLDLHFLLLQAHYSEDDFFEILVFDHFDYFC